MSQCTAIIDIETMSIVAKFIPGLSWLPGSADPTPGEGQVAVPIPETLSWTCVNTVSQDKDGNWIFSENLEFKQQLWRDLRQSRNERLAESDWTQLADVSVNRQDWLVYRQVLRDLPSTTIDPARPSWPEKPT